MTGLAQQEFAALRDTIRARGGARPWAFLAGLGAWALALLAVLAWVPNPLASVVPLVLLLGTFEALRTLHLGIERIGRYLQAFYEDDGGVAAGPSGPPCWEHVAMQLGPSLPGAGGHPYFLPVLLLAVTINFLAVLLPDPFPVELIMLAVPHVSLIVWMLYCDRGMRRQRVAELARFRAIKSSLTRATDTTAPLQSPAS